MATTLAGKKPGKKPEEKAGKKIAVTIQGKRLEMTPEEIRTLIGQLSSALRKKHVGNVMGRPWKEGVERCACGLMTLARAKRRYHVCGEKS